MPQSKRKYCFIQQQDVTVYTFLQRYCVFCFAFYNSLWLELRVKNKQYKSSINFIIFRINVSHFAKHSFDLLVSFPFMICFSF